MSTEPPVMGESVEGCGLVVEQVNDTLFDGLQVRAHCSVCGRDETIEFGFAELMQGDIQSVEVVCSKTEEKAA